MAGVALAVEGGVGFATKSYTASALYYTTLASLSCVLSRSGLASWFVVME